VHLRSSDAGSERSDLIGRSSRFHLRTRYMRTVYSATIDLDEGSPISLGSHLSEQSVRWPCRFPRRKRSVKSSYVPLIEDCMVLTGPQDALQVCGWLTDCQLEGLQSPAGRLELARLKEQAIKHCKGKNGSRLFSGQGRPSNEAIFV